ncbi:MAG TPA: serine/threonine-protein kinase [Pedobacter sp.]|uniref:serine/threonine-protein kinase n=1 Tax=Pedobacter sp. TaxID=1411316 RepID=UPI002B5AB001|nr:serine/threonine-protein kinase [Pedobacter sp.]HMI04877.1 serine/threonine-protein kinase [Pedobacter sp.]
MPLGLQTASLNFETLKEIGQAGKNSRVYIANDKQLESQIVIKQIKKDSLTYEGDYYKEAKILYNHEHSNVAKVNYGCEDDEHVYIAMPYYRRGSLKDIIDKRFLTNRETIRYAIQFLSGLNHIHSNRLMHFDIKPDNIFITDSNEAVLADFGLAKAMNIYDTAAQYFVYSKQQPPEVFTGDDYTYAFDIYLAGLTLYKMCNGLDSFELQYAVYGEDTDSYVKAVLKGEFPSREKYSWHIPNGLRKVINRALSPDQADRYQTALQLINALGAIDEMMDWKYAVITNVHVWSLDLDDKVITIKLSNNGQHYSVLTEKFIKKSGNTTKISDHCNANIISKKDVKKIVIAALKALS